MNEMAEIMKIKNACIRMIKKIDDALQEDVLVFVYGTLLKGCINHRLLEKIDAKFVCKDKINASMFTIKFLGYPFIKLYEKDIVIGEIYSIKNNNIEIIDGLEGYQKNDKNSLFIRHEIMTLKGHKVFVYEGGKQLSENTKQKYIFNGNWKKWELENVNNV